MRDENALYVGRGHDGAPSWASGHSDDSCSRDNPAHQPLALTRYPSSLAPDTIALQLNLEKRAGVSSSDF